MSYQKIDRREFLKVMGFSSMLFTLPFSAGCLDQTKPNTDIKVSLVKDSDESDAIVQAIDMIGGMDFLSSGDSVLLKLALNSPNLFPATTSPFVISELISLLKDRGAGDVFVGDKSPFWYDETGGTVGCMKETGIYQAVVDAGAEVVVFEEEDMVHVKPQKAAYWPGGFSRPKIFNQVDHIIALPTLRTHQIADFTMSMKIFVGAIPQKERFYIHRSNHFLEGIAEISLCTDKIRLSLLDARQGFNSEGPDSGNLISPGIIIASNNIVAADILGLALMKTVGTTDRLMNMSIWDHPTIKRGVEVHCSALSAETIELLYKGIENIEEIKTHLLT